MRKSAKALLLVFVALIGAVVLSIGSAFSAAIAFGAAVGLIVPGTGTHNVVTATQYRDNAALRYIDPAGTPVCTGNPASCNTIGVNYPATFWPLFFFSGWCPGANCDTWDKSVSTGVTNLEGAVDAALNDPANPDQDVVVFGYSQGGAVVSQALYNLNQLPTLDKNRISVVTIGNINNPLGLWSRLGFLSKIPLFDITFNPQLPTTGIASTNYSFEYDPVGDAPEYWGNPLALLNAVAAFEYVHGDYLAPNENGESDTLPYGYDDGTLATAIANAPKRIFGNATFVLIPQQGALPIFQPFVDLANATSTRALIDPLISLIQPVTKVLINLGYDRTTNPGIPQVLSILPFNPLQNWATIGKNIFDAVGEGITNVIKGVDVTRPPTTPPGDPSTGAPDSPFTPQQSPAGTSNVVSSASAQPITTAAKVDSKSVAAVTHIGATAKAKAAGTGTTAKAGTAKVAAPKAKSTTAGAGTREHGRTKTAA
jgi:PE-PPE domain